ncbi:MAG TPA: NAD-dependent epimerase/dehydratase family protein [Chloroflexota bacterium]|nr:NAD-dependent epimerase/dehydratase family protein [Chloroflexota bacterium]
MSSEAELDDLLTTPTPEVVAALRATPGDLLVLGAGGKMGPTLTLLAARAIRAGGLPARVIAVSRFSEAGLRERLEEQGVATIACDLLEDGALDRLPDAANVVLMAGRKFGSTGAESLTWAMNTALPALVAGRYRRSRLVVFSTGNVYPLVPVTSGGATEDLAPEPIGEYAQSCLGRERLVQYASDRHGTPAVILRLNYAIDLRYGILLEVARSVYAGNPVALTMGNVNVIWQGDANAVALRSLALAASPPLVLNLTGPETVSIRALACRFARLLDRPAPVFTGVEAPTSLLSNAGRVHACFGYPQVSLDHMVRWVGNWVQVGGSTLDKPTHFEQRDGRF